MKKIIFYLVILFFGSCDKDNAAIEYLDVHFVEYGANMQTPLDCSFLQGTWGTGLLHHKKITNKDFLRKFKKLYTNYKSKTSKDTYDIRIKVIIHSSNQTDTLCLGENFSTFLNGKRMIDQPKLLNLLQDELDYKNGKKPKSREK